MENLTKATICARIGQEVVLSCYGNQLEVIGSLELRDPYFLDRGGGIFTIIDPVLLKGVVAEIPEGLLSQAGCRGAAPPRRPLPPAAAATWQ